MHNLPLLTIWITTVLLLRACWEAFTQSIKYLLIIYLSSIRNTKVDQTQHICGFKEVVFMTEKYNKVVI